MTEQRYNNQSVTLGESFLLDSKIYISGEALDQRDWQKPTSAQKWWASALIGMTFAVLASSLMSGITNSISTSLHGPNITSGQGLTLAGLLVHTTIMILVIRVILG